MMSCACGRMVIGSGERRSTSFSPQNALICGVSEEVAQVSITSISGVQVSPPQLGHAWLTSCLA